MEPGDDCGYCRFRTNPNSLSDSELSSYTVDEKHPNPSAIVNAKMKRTCSVACTKFKIVLHLQGDRNYENGGCRGFSEK